MRGSWEAPELVKNWAKTAWEAAGFAAASTLMHGAYPTARQIGQQRLKDIRGTFFGSPRQKPVTEIRQFASKVAAA
jgi:hypothetical protein